REASSRTPLPCEREGAGVLGQVFEEAPPQGEVADLGCLALQAIARHGQGPAGPGMVSRGLEGLDMNEPGVGAAEAEGAERLVLVHGFLGGGEGLGGATL